MPEPRRATPHRPPGALLKAFLRPSRGQFAAGVALFLTALIVVVTLRSPWALNSARLASMMRSRVLFFGAMGRFEDR